MSVDLVAEARALAKKIGGVTLLDDTAAPKQYEGYSFGSRMLNLIVTGSLDIGLVRGRIYEVYGPEGSGKTTLCLHAIAEVQKAGGFAGYVDAEHAVDIKYAAALGVRTTECLFSQPDSGEEALQLVQRMCESNMRRKKPKEKEADGEQEESKEAPRTTRGVSLIVVDSVAALVPQAEIEGDIGDSHVGLQARLMSRALRKLSPIVKKSGTILVFVNQIREKIGVMFGNPETTPGGRALRYYASVRLDVRSYRMDKIKMASGDRKTVKKNGVDDDELGVRLTVEAKKNRLAPPFKMAKLAIIYGKGIDRRRDALAVGVYAGIVSEVSDQEFQYRKKTRSIANTDVETYKKILAEAREVLGRKQ